MDRPDWSIDAWSVGGFAASGDRTAAARSDATAARRANCGSVSIYSCRIWRADSLGWDSCSRCRPMAWLNRVVAASARVMPVSIGSTLDHLREPIRVFRVWVKSLYRD